MSADTLLQRINNYANRPDPYPLYAELREAGGVVRQTDGSYLVGTYHEINDVLHDPRISSDQRNLSEPYRVAEEESHPPAFIVLDDPEHHRLRNILTRPFGPPHSPGRVDAMRSEIAKISEELIDAFGDHKRIDVVDDFAYPLPVTVICRLLGVPRDDEPLFREWSTRMIEGADVVPGEDRTARVQASKEAREAMGDYLADLAEQRRGKPADDMLSAFVNEPDPAQRLTREELAVNAAILLLAGHETTVNLISNGVLTLLRHPDQLERLRRDPALMPKVVEELLRYEPPVHLVPIRTPLVDVDVAGTTVPKGVRLVLALASGNRDPRRFSDPDRFDPAREDSAHLGFGGGVHICYGAALARVEAQIALAALIRRLDSPRLTEDPPPYRTSATLRGPRHLWLRGRG
ncbi:cytochrome P450 [Streptomyces sp. NPDC002896]|uniref:cytochrome P450 n=1 Tax=Streptomyces sp. NPDC002896 TaxID=3154438 RepID=UPI00332767D9